jgi:hypothetical protein
MEPGDDRELHDLLKEWRVTGAPRSLDQRVLQRRAPWWRALLKGSIRIPVPMALAAAVILFLLTAALLTRKPAAEPAPSFVSLANFQPVSDLNVRVIRNGSN